MSGPEATCKWTCEVRAVAVLSATSRPGSGEDDETHASAGENVRVAAWFDSSSPERATAATVRRGCREAEHQARRGREGGLLGDREEPEILPRDELVQPDEVAIHDLGSGPALALDPFVAHHFKNVRASARNRRSLPIVWSMLSLLFPFSRRYIS